VFDSEPYEETDRTITFKDGQTVSFGVLPSPRPKLKRLPTWVLVVVYLAAIVAANLLVARYGQIALLFTAVALLPTDFLIRDILHSRWEVESKYWFFAMALLVGSGGVITLLVNYSAVNVALASSAAFCAAGVSNAAVYASIALDRKFTRMTASNAVASVVDSVLFPLLAFGTLDWRISAGQAALKFIGGLLLTIWYLRRTDPRAIFLNKDLRA